MKVFELQLSLLMDMEHYDLDEKLLFDFSPSVKEVIRELEKNKTTAEGYYAEFYDKLIGRLALCQDPIQFPETGLHAYHRSGVILRCSILNVLTRDELENRVLEPCLY